MLHHEKHGEDSLHIQSAVSLSLHEKQQKTALHIQECSLTITSREATEDCTPHTECSLHHAPREATEDCTPHTECSLLLHHHGDELQQNVDSVFCCFIQWACSTASVRGVKLLVKMINCHIHVAVSLLSLLEKHDEDSLCIQSAVFCCITW